MNVPQELPQDPHELYELVQEVSARVEYRRLVADGRLRRLLEDGRLRRRLEDGKETARAAAKEETFEEEQTDSFLATPEEPDLLEALRPDPPGVV